MAKPAPTREELRDRLTKFIQELEKIDVKLGKFFDQAIELNVSGRCRASLIQADTLIGNASSLLWQVSYDFLWDEVPEEEDADE